MNNIPLSSNDMIENKRHCRQCGEKIPKSIVIDGKTRNLASRKFCLVCSPFGSCNRSKYGPLLKGLVKPKKYSDKTQEQKDKNLAYQYHREKALKQFYVDMMGGKCQKCGYNKELNCLSFHHRDPKEKKFNVSSREMIGRSIEEVELELSKCDLLCLNCHMELEASIRKSKYDHVVLDKQYDPTNTRIGRSINMRERTPEQQKEWDALSKEEKATMVVHGSDFKPYALCKNCSAQISKETKNNLCHPCYSLGQRKVERPSREELLKLLETNSCSAVARMFKVSDNAVRKWLGLKVGETVR